MRALVTRLNGGTDKPREKVLVEDWPETESPVRNQVSIRTRYSGITNGTERNDLIGGNYAHTDDTLPAGWGYQIVGEIEACGPEVNELAVGDMVYVSCDHLEWACIEEDGWVVKLPDAVYRKEAALFGMASVGMRTVSNSGPHPNQDVLIVGAGVIGQVACQLASFRGCRVTLCDLDHQRLRIAEEISGVDRVVNGSDWDNTIEDQSFHHVIDFAGAVDMEDRLLRTLRLHGVLNLVAGRFRVDYSLSFGQERQITIKQNSHFDRDDLHTICRLVSKGSVKLTPLLRDVVPVTEAKRIYDTLRDNPQDLLETVFDWVIE